MYCSVCVELSIEADDKGLYGKDAYNMQNAITQVNGTVLCYEHAKPFFEKLRKERTAGMTELGLLLSGINAK